MPALDRDTSALLVIDFQSRLMPAIEDAAAVVVNTCRLLDAAELLDVPVLFTEQNAGGLGPTMPALRMERAELFHKMTFDACRIRAFSRVLSQIFS
jgi:nicotinamidase-related amidase